MATVISYQARTRRLVHFVLVVGAFFIGAGANLLVDLGRHDAIAESTWWQISIVGAAAFVVYLVAAIRVSYADPILLPVALLLNLIGLAEIKSVDLVYEQYTKWNHGFAPRQVIWTVLGLALTAAVLLILRDHRQLRRYTWITGAIGLIFLLMPLMPGIGAANYGARIWIRVAGYSFQPAEIAKILFAMFFAGFLVSRRDTLALAGPRVLGITLPRWSDLGPILVAWLCATAVLVFPRGEAIVVFRVEVDEVGVGSNVFSRGGGAIKPLDLAQGLKRECDDQIQVLDRSRTLAPNTYFVYLNSEDYDRFASWEDTLVDELQHILVDHADQQKYLFVGNVTVTLERDDEVKAGRFETESKTERSSLAPATGGGKSFQPILEIDGQQYLLTGPVTVVGRGGDSDIILDDTGVSRHHVELRVDGNEMTATDLGSTNGTFVNGERITTPTSLPDGATIRMGRTRITVVLPTGSTTEW